MKIDLASECKCVNQVKSVDVASGLTAYSKRIEELEELVRAKVTHSAGNWMRVRLYDPEWSN